MLVLSYEFAERRLLMPIQFTQSCPTCGRRIQIQASLMGHSVACPHCRAEFDASAGIAKPAEIDGRIRVNHMVDTEPVDPLMARVEKALARANDQSTAIG